MRPFKLVIALIKTDWSLYIYLNLNARTELSGILILDLPEESAAYNNVYKNSLTLSEAHNTV